MRHVFYFVGIAVITAIFLFLAYQVEVMLLNNIIIPPVGVTIEQWLDTFKRCAIVGVAISGAVSLLWYILGQWAFKVNDWGSAGKRGIWGLFFLVPLLTIVPGVYYTRHAQKWAEVGYLFYLLNGLLLYYLATALFSSAKFKYTPLFASKIRHW